MSKICFLGDTHHGLRNADPRFIEYFKKYYDEWFFPELKQRGIRNIFQFGDLFDKRIGVDTVTIAESKQYFFDRLVQDKIKMQTLLGNHDLAKKDTLKYNSPEQVLNEYPNIEIFSTPETITLGEFTVDVIPWICKENHDEIMKFVEQSESDFAFGHFEFAGYPMYKGVESHGGMDAVLFKKYKQVLSGHYHTRSRKGNVFYIGTPAEYVWSDAEDPKGFHVFDTETGEMEFVENPFTIHQKLYYSEKLILEHQTAKKATFDLSSCSGKFVKLYVIDSTDRKLYDKYYDALASANPLDIKVIEEFVPVESTVDDGVNVKNSSVLIDNYVENMDTDLDRERLKRMLRKYYIDAQNESGDD